MTEQNQKQLGNTLWDIANQLRGAMDEIEKNDFNLNISRYISTAAVNTNPQFYKRKAMT